VAGAVTTVSFEDTFESEVKETFGDLGPEATGGAAGAERPRGGDRTRGGRRGAPRR